MSQPPNEFESSAHWSLDAAVKDAELTPIDWATLPDGVHRVTFDAPSGPLAGIEAGDPTSPRVLLVPGVTGSKEDFQRMMVLFAQAGYFVQSFDLAGQYESRDAGPERLNPARSRYDLQLFVDDLVSVLSVHDSPSHVLGYSFAGTVAQAAYVQSPHLFSSLAFLSAPPEPGLTFRSVKRIGWLSPLVSDSVGASLMIWGVKSNVIPVTEDRLRFVKDRFEYTRRSSVRDIIGLMMQTPDFRETLAQSDLPKFVAVGQHDLWPREVHQAFADQIDARFAVYPTGHSPCETTPHQLVRDLLEFYQGTS